VLSVKITRNDLMF